MTTRTPSYLRRPSSAVVIDHGVLLRSDTTSLGWRSRGISFFGLHDRGTPSIQSTAAVHHSPTRRGGSDRSRPKLKRPHTHRGLLPHRQMLNQLRRRWRPEVRGLRVRRSGINRLNSLNARMSSTCRNTRPGSSVFCIVCALLLRRFCGGLRTETREMPERPTLVAMDRIASSRIRVKWKKPAVLRWCFRKHTLTVSEHVASTRARRLVLGGANALPREWLSPH